MKSQTKYNLIAFAIALISAGLLAYYFGEKISVSKQLGIFHSLSDISAIIFAIMGAWIAIIYPESITKIYSSTDREVITQHSNRVGQLITPMLLGLFIVFFVLILDFIHPVICIEVKLAPDNGVVDILRSVLFFFLVLLTFSLLFFLLKTLLIAYSFKQSIVSQAREKTKRDGYKGSDKDN
jgi:hypothetical protein